MRAWTNILVVAVAVIIAGSFFFEMVRRVRDASNRDLCQNNLRQIAVAAHGFHSEKKRFPTALGTLPPDQRLSWMISIASYLEAGPWVSMDEQQPWDAAVNRPVRCLSFVDEHRPLIHVLGARPVLNCPSNPVTLDETSTALAHYVGIAGVGEDAPDLPVVHDRAGIFGNDRIVRFKDLRRGSSQTIFAMETQRVGPWSANGWPTVRGTIPDSPSYFDVGGPFASRHRLSSYVLFADGHAQSFRADTPTRMIDALAVLAAEED